MIVPLPAYLCRALLQWDGDAGQTISLNNLTCGTPGITTRSGAHAPQEIQTMATVVTQRPPLRARAKRSFAKALTFTGSILAALAGLGWTGLQIRPPPSRQLLSHLHR
jgi:hypothetical protein